MKLMFKYMSMYLRSQLEYKSSFILSLIAQSLSTMLSFFMVLILMNKFNFMDNYNIYHVILGISIVQFGFSFAECFGRGFDKFSLVIKKGSLDLMLVRPRNVYIQVFGSNIEFSKLSRVFGSLILFIIAIYKLDFNKSLLNIFLFILLLLFSSLIYFSLQILSACLCFKTIEGLEFVNIFTDGSREFGQYPMGLFKREVLIVFTYLIPIACVNYYPLMYFIGKSNNTLYAFLPLIVLIYLIPCFLIFNKGSKNYLSTGS